MPVCRLACCGFLSWQSVSRFSSSPDRASGGGTMFFSYRNLSVSALLCMFLSSTGLAIIFRVPAAAPRLLRRTPGNCVGKFCPATDTAEASERGNWRHTWRSPFVQGQAALNDQNRRASLSPSARARESRVQEESREASTAGTTPGLLPGPTRPSSVEGATPGTSSVTRTSSQAPRTESYLTLTESLYESTAGSYRRRQGGDFRSIDARRGNAFQGPDSPTSYSQSGRSSHRHPNGAKSVGLPPRPHHRLDAVGSSTRPRTAISEPRKISFEFEDEARLERISRG